METIVMYPSPGIGHLVSMVELAKLILNHHPSFSITILITTPPFNTGSTAPYIASVSATTPSISFHHLPTTTLPKELTSYPSFEAITFDLLRLNVPNVRHALCSIPPVLAMVVDVFCTPIIPVATELKVPAYSYFPTCVSSLIHLLYTPILDRTTTGNFKDLDTLIDIPGLPTIRFSEMPDPVLVRTRDEYKIFLGYARYMLKSAGIIVNTFESIEARAVKAISDGLCFEDGPAPPLFCVGPLIGGGGSNSGGESKCLTWLELQPRQSVVFLCFGSLGLFSKEQLRQIAIGLERSKHRFLWVVRSPPTDDEKQRFLTPPDPDLDELLPDGFLDRTKEQGLVVRSWAPQVAVLNHGSVGGFVTHCGWNSVLEAVCAGVPMVAWPLYAEQKFNRVVLVEEVNVALSMNSESKDGIVNALEVENRIKELMESEKGELVRKQIQAVRDGAIAALSNGGSSLVDLTRLVESWKLE